MHLHLITTVFDNTFVINHKTDNIKMISQGPIIVKIVVL